jgi:hypothetical protein
MARRSSPSRAFERMANYHTLAQRLGAHALCAAVLAACGITPPPQAAPAAQVPHPPPPPAPSCPRLPRAARTWTGFAVDVPSQAMHLALDALVPIQTELGALFCGPERAPCRPVALVSIELADASARSARVELDTGREAPGFLQLHELNGSWRAESESLEAFLSACRAVGPR